MTVQRPLEPQLTSAVSQGGASLGSSQALSQALVRVRQGQSLDLAPARIMSLSEHAQLARGIGSFFEEHRARLVRSAVKHPDPAKALLQVLRKASLSSQLTGYDSPEQIRPLLNSLRGFVNTRKPLPVALPLGGGKVGSPLKTGSSFLPDMGEWIQAARLAALAAALEELHPPGAFVVLVPDAPLHTADMGFSMVDVQEHLRQFREDIRGLGFDRWVRLEPQERWLPPHWSSEVERLTREARERMEHDQTFRKVASAQTQSLQFTLNQSVLGLTYEEHALTMGTFLGLLEDVPTHIAALARQHHERTKAITAHYIGVNHALRTLDITGRASELHTSSRDHLRATVHAKPSEPRPALHQPGPQARPGLLPMHSVTQRYLSKGKSRFASVFDLEARLAGLRPVLDPTGTRPLFLEDQTTILK